MNDIINNVVALTLPMIIVSIVVILLLRIRYLYKNKIHFTLYKELFYLASIVYVLALFQVVTQGDVVSWSSNNFIPFKEIFRYRLFSRLFIKNVLGNIIMFLPFGFFASYYLKSDNYKEATIMALITSITIECVQMMIGRVFDVDDIILNTLGGFIGFYFYYICHIISEKIPNIFRNELFLDFLAILFLLGVLSLL